VLARVHDAEGSSRLSLIRIGLGPLLCLAVASVYGIPLSLARLYPIQEPLFWGHAIWSIKGAEYWFGAILAVAGIIGILWPFLLPRRRSQVCSVESWKGGLLLCAPGSSRTQQIPGADIAALRVAEAAEGASLLLVRRNRTAVFLELEDIEQARSLATPLLKNSLGTGDVALAACIDGTSSDVLRDRVEWTVRIAGLLSWVLCFACWDLRGDPFDPFWVGISYLYWYGMPVPIFLVGVLCVLAGFALRRLRLHGRKSLVLGKDALRIEGALEIQYGDIESVEVQRRGITIVLREGSSDRRSLGIRLPGLSPDELAHVTIHILSAANNRAAETNEPRPPAWKRLHDLSRRQDEPVRTWLSRLDALDTNPSADPYRHTAIERVDLASMIADVEAPVALRVAATRVLRRIDPEDTRRRIGEVEARSEPEVARRLKIAAEADLDDASEAYEALPPPFRARMRQD